MGKMTLIPGVKVSDISHSYSDVPNETFRKIVLWHLQELMKDQRNITEEFVKMIMFKKINPNRMN